MQSFIQSCTKVVKKKKQQNTKDMLNCDPFWDVKFCLFFKLFSFRLIVFIHYVNNCVIIYKRKINMEF